MSMTSEATKTTEYSPRPFYPLELAKNMSIGMSIVSVPVSTFHFLYGGKRAFLDGLPASLRLGGNIALCSGVKLSASRLRRKDDAWNSFLAGAALGAVIALRNKELVASNTLLRFGRFASIAITSGVLFAAFDGAVR